MFKRHNVATRVLAGLLIIWMVGCDDGDGDGDGDGGSDGGSDSGVDAGPQVGKGDRPSQIAPIESESIIHVDPMSGENQLGGIYSLLDTDLSMRSLHVYGGRPTGLRPGNDEGAFAFNPSDGLFYGIIDDSGFFRAQVLVSFDPKTDNLRILKNYAPIRSGEYPAYGFHTKPIISPDGKSLIASAGLGGDELDENFDEYQGEGMLVHFDIDPASDTYLDATPVLEYADIPAREVWAEPVYAEGKIWLVSEGSFVYNTTGSQESRSNTFSAAPTVADDWSQPWSATVLDTGNRSLGGLLGYQLHYDGTNDEVIWAYFTPPTTETVFEGNDWAGGLVNAPQGCYWNTGVFALDNSSYFSFCRGISVENDPRFDHLRTDPALVEMERNGAATIRTRFPLWLQEDIFPVASVLSADTSKAIVNVAEKGGTTRVINNAFRTEANQLPVHYPAIEEIDLGTFARQRLVLGNEEIGTQFIGTPEVGGLPSEPLPDRYVVWFAFDGGYHDWGTVLKYDRVEDTTTYVSLGTQQAHPWGDVLHHSNGKVYGTMQAESFDYRDAFPGHFVYDPSNGDFAADHVERYRYLGLYNYVYTGTTTGPRLVESATGTILGLGVGNALGNATQNLYRVDPDTGAGTVLTHWNIAAPSSWQLHALALSDTDPQLAVFPLAHDDGVTHSLICYDLLNHTQGATPPLADGIEDDAHAPLTNATWSASQSLFYLPTRGTSKTDEGGIQEIDIKDCTAPTRNQVLDALTDLPSTPLVATADGSLYYGTDSGKIMQFTPNPAGVSEVVDLAPAGGTAKVFGFLSEDDQGRLMGFVEVTEGGDTTREFFRYDSGDVTRVDVSDTVSEGHLYPGAIALPNP